MAEFKGKLNTIMLNPLNHRYIVSFETDEAPELLQDGKELSIKVAPYRKKRSLDSNAMAWLLMSKIAEVEHTSKEEVYELMLRRYGVPWQDDDGNYYTFTSLSDKPLPEGIHAKCIGTHWQNDKSFDSWLLLKGSSEFDTLEMSHFLDSIVDECHILGISTDTPDEIARIEALWNH